MSSCSLQLTWSEFGGPPVSVPDRLGFGTKLIERALAQGTSGEAKIDYRPGGVVWSFKMPLTDTSGERQLEGN